MAQPVWGVTVFFVNLWVYMVIPEQPQTPTAVSAWGRGALSPPHRLCKIKNHSLRSHNFLLKHNFLPVHLLLRCRENAGVIVGLAWTMFLINWVSLIFILKGWITSLFSLYGRCFVCAAADVLLNDKQESCCMFKFTTDARKGINERKTNKRSGRPQWVIRFLAANESQNTLSMPPLSTAT